MEDQAKSDPHGGIGKCSTGTRLESGFPSVEAQGVRSSFAQGKANSFTHVCYETSDKYNEDRYHDNEAMERNRSDRLASGIA